MYQYILGLKTSLLAIFKASNLKSVNYRDLPTITIILIQDVKSFHSEKRPSATVLENLY